MRQKVSELFKEKEGQVFFPDSPEEANGKWQHLDKPLEVILFGDLLRKFFQTGNYVHDQYRFSQLSSSFQKIFNHLLLKREDLSGSNLISRYDLFPQSRVYDFDMEKEMNFIFAGRLSYQKNIPYLLYFIKACSEQGLSLKAHLYGEYDNQFHEHLGRRSLMPLQVVLEKIIEEEELRDIVFFRGFVDSKAWVETSVDQPIAVSMSTFIGEDFGVSLAQAQEKGWPILCSAFGGHKDIYGESISFIPSSWIGHSHLPLSLQKVLAKKAAESFVKYGFHSIKESQREDNLSGLMSLSQLDEARRKLALELGISSQWLNLEGLDVFADLKEGSLFLRHYLDHLETPKHEESLEVSFIFSEEERETLGDETLGWFTEITSELSMEDHLNFIFEADLHYPDSLLFLKRSKKAHCSKKVGPKTSDFIKNLFGN